MLMLKQDDVILPALKTKGLDICRKDLQALIDSIAELGKMIVPRGRGFDEGEENRWYEVVGTFPDNDAASHAVVNQLAAIINIGILCQPNR